MNDVNRATVDGTDVQAAMAASLIRELDKAGASKCIKGMSFDLTSAYRQLAVSDKSLRFARVCVYNPKEGVAQCYQPAKRSGLYTLCTHAAVVGAPTPSHRFLFL